MRATKDSGVEWVGEIPENWRIKPLKSVCLITNSGVWGGEPHELISGSLMPVATTAQISPDGRFLVQAMQVRSLTPLELKAGGTSKGDIVVVKSSGSADNIISGKAGYVREAGLFCFGNFLMRLRAKHSTDSRFLYYFVTSNLTRQRVERMVSTTTYPNLKVSEYTSAMVPLPSYEEQKAIANFLDRETAKIDKLIVKQEQLITTLGERRKALISKQISQGSNLAEGLVDSGNPQIGKFPRQWKAKRLRHFARLQSGADYKEIETSENGFPVYGSGGIFTHATKYMYDGESVLFGRKGTIDRPLYVNGPFWTVDTMYWTRFVNDINPKFVYYWATTLPFGLFTTATALPSMTASDIKNFFIGVPPRVEQDKIVQFLDAVTSSLDALGKRSLRVVEVLKERRQALISAAVTGKLEVGV